MLKMMLDHKIQIKLKMRKRKGINLTKRQIYWKYKNGNKEGVDEKLFNKIIDLFLLKVRDKILDENYIFKLPHIGYRIKIVKYQKNPFDKDGNLLPFRFPVNWKETKNYWDKNPEAKKNKKCVYYLNDHTDGYIYRIKMFPAFREFKNMKMYTFKASKPFSIKLAYKLLDPYNKQDYYEL